MKNPLLLGETKTGTVVQGPVHDLAAGTGTGIATETETGIETGIETGTGAVGAETGIGGRAVHLGAARAAPRLRRRKRRRATGTPRQIL
jgi:hypothetical protein